MIENKHIHLRDDTQKTLTVKPLHESLRHNCEYAADTIVLWCKIMMKDNKIEYVYFNGYCVRMGCCNFVETISKRVISKPTIKVLSLRHCGLYALECEHICKIMKKTSLLEEMDISSNNIRNGMMFILDGLSVNKTIKKMVMQNCVDYTDMGEMEKMLKNML